MTPIKIKTLSGTLGDKKLVKYQISYPEFQGDYVGLNQYYRIEAEERVLEAKKLYAMASMAFQKGTAGLPFELIDTVKVTYHKGNIVSLYIDSYDYTGGAHGLTTRKGDTWSLPSCQRVSFSSLVKNVPDCKAWAENEILRQIKEQKTEHLYFKGYSGLIMKYFDDKRFYLTCCGACLYFQLYEIAPYATGIPVFTLPYGAHLACPC